MNADSKRSAQSDTLVMKFGGTSVGSAAAIRKAAGIARDCRKQWARTTVVVSALSGVTNLLLESAAQAATGDHQVGERAAETLLQRHLETASELLGEGAAFGCYKAEVTALTSEFRNLCGAMAVLGESTPRALDAVASLGERLSARLFSLVLNELGTPSIAVDATELIVTDSKFQAAHPNLVLTRSRTQSRLVPMLEQGLVPVVTGFIGATADGVTTTLGRGGSDYSAAILGVALDAREVWIWTDVDGVMSADPRVVREARTIPALSYRELAELAYFGAKVVHPMTMRPVIEAGIGLVIKNTFNPDHPGTRLIERSEDYVHVIKAVTSIRGQNLVTIEGRGMLGVPGVAARTFSAVAATGTNVILISQASSEQSICFAVPHDRSRTVVHALEECFATELRNRDIDRIWSSEEVVIVTVVGAGMRHTPGVAGRVFTALGSCEVNVIAIAQGSSEVAISLVVDSKDMEAAVRSLHRLIGASVENEG